MRWRAPVVGLLLLVASAAAQAQTRGDLQGLLDSVRAAHRDIPGIAIHVEAPGRGWSWTVLSGQAGPRAALTPRHAYRIASNTKTYVAAAVLRLWEQGKLGLDDPISRHLPVRYRDPLRADGYDIDAISIRHLLSHTSGLYDWGTDSGYGARVTADPAHRWSRLEQVRFAMDHGEPYGLPGEVYHYSDTGYILLGEIVEQLTGQPLGPAMRDLLKYRANRLGGTWLESLEPMPAGLIGRAHQWQGPVDTYRFDPSMDLWGGGGLTTTMADLARFNRALLRGGVFDRSGTVDTMLSPVPARNGGGYRLGISESTLEGFRSLGHTGYWNTFAYHLPELDVTIAGAVLQNARYEVAGALATAIVQRLEPRRARLLARVRSALASAVANDQVPAALVYLDSPKLSLHFGGSAGVSVRGGATARASQPLRIASNTKTYTAAAILLLAERGKLAVDVSAAEYLSAESIQLLSTGGYDPLAITVRHLLQHVSGLYDYATDSAFVRVVTNEPARRWTRADQVRWALEHGKPVGKPGERFHYSDTGYVLLGEIIERATGVSLGTAYRDLLGFERLGLDRTWLETIDPDPWFGVQRLHQYLGATDTYEFDPSFDLFGGGGLAATTRDMAAFTRHLLVGRIFGRPETLQLMLERPVVQADRDYRMGLYRRVTAGEEGFGHTGFWGTASFYYPALDLAVSAAVTQQEAGPVLAALLEAVVKAVREVDTAVP